MPVALCKHVCICGRVSPHVFKQIIHTYVGAAASLIIKDKRSFPLQV